MQKLDNATALFEELEIHILNIIIIKNIFYIFQFYTYCSEELILIFF